MGANTAGLTTADVEAFLHRLGERYLQQISLYIIGGAALSLLGSQRRTLDIDYVGSDLPSKDDVLAMTIRTLATEMKIEVEGVPLDQFIPIPQGAALRHRLVGRYGALTAYVFDPYSIAISKIDRGFEIDLQDVVFLIRNRLIALDLLEDYVTATLLQAAEYDLDSHILRQHLLLMKRLLI
jgi:hypothetical protein